MKPTREQLELAAKAAGIEIYLTKSTPDRVFYRLDICEEWRPTEDKSESFELMVACGIDVEFNEAAGIVYTEKHSCCIRVFVDEDYNNDKGLATMWAIFLCAVEIGGAVR